ncbi:aldehyde dehydrogenase family protein [Oceanobacillus sp. 143]|uniref:Betaine-aldehyde dehydrogenase n=1 Tax=Oceanobacillus zhaokaii TaxID=2052660 RepID=A0A345PEU9_9BACI|nr:aldehyde dehydrogenase family protein [Oceanobacillus zhaokaii]AXI08529.1 betaine-aldehyde dehydrogenase [Oceanobacillus zhaokaii]QGS68356.1 aldehyde dehydrogenase family protein [Oceanobacillus sp. 143]
METTLIKLNENAARFVSKPKKMFISGRWVDAVSGKTFETRNPATGDLITSVPEGDKADIDLAVRAARHAFDEGPWRTLKPYDRSKLLLKLADLFEENAEELAHLETLDNGAPLSMTKHYPGGAAENIRYYAGWTTKITGETVPVSVPGKVFNYTRKEPIGVCGQIIPWNGPLMMAVWKLSTALATGNTVVLKPAENTPLTALRIGELVQEAGFPDGVVNIVTGFGSTAGQSLVDHPLVDKIAFTGSTAVGKQIMKSSSANLKKVSLELGGKSAHIVFADADYEKALQNAANAILLNSGQVCVAGSRLFVEKKIYDNFMSDLADYTKNYKLGNGFDPSANLGPLISAKQKERVLGYLDLGRDEGAEMLVGGNAADGLENGYFVKPTVLANVNNSMRIAQEEIFGPVVSGIPFTDIDEVIKLANQTEYGLGGGVNTTDIRKAHLVAEGLRTGSVWVNTYNLIDPASPFGGYKQSGLGRENGAESIDLYTETKSVWINLD